MVRGFKNKSKNLTQVQYLNSDQVQQGKKLVFLIENLKQCGNQKKTL